ncbi:MAG: 7,8-didemethyl-8-hydroxy-5-deazariboflavin synthase [Actinobacteria bacterium]|nr:MAG: 7,8-didemethyl-8-hydroxy-5-deazariboflavin synthase [Actinomycetota bacterium]
MDVAHAVRRALRRADEGKTLSLDEAEALLSARHDDLEHLMAIARRVRDAGVGRTVSYSRKVFIPLTRLCRDRCGYCTFATTPERLDAPFLSPEEVLDIARAGAAAGCKEALFTLGDRPESRWPEARAWLAARGYASTLDYVRAMAILVIEETGLLPHLNPGVMSWEEMARLKPVAPSMGMMLETTSERLYRTPGAAHYGSPDKKPSVRLRVIEDAGRLAIPFTTGILIGIGETARERTESLFALRAPARQYGHIQEVIVQNFVAKPLTAMASQPDAAHDDYLATIALARILLGPRATVQSPPNLSDERFPELLDAGINDWGGVSPVTIDHVNPEKPWPQIERLRAETEARGSVLRERLTIYPSYAIQPDPWIDGRVLGAVEALRAPDGYARADAQPRGVPWQAPDVVLKKALSGSIRLIENSESATDDLERGLRADTNVIHGNWDALEVGVSRAWASRPARNPGEMNTALARADSGAILSEEEALTLFEAEGDALEQLCRIADDMRRDAVGDVVTYVINRNINFTNICYVGCRFCAFAQRRDDADAYFLSNDEVAARAQEAWDWGATEVCIQGGIHPDLPGDYYFDLLRAIKARVPAMHIHAFSPMEVLNGASRLGISFAEWLTEAKRAGLGSTPGTAAEILDDDVRWVLTKGKLPADTWEQIIRTAHGLGIRSSSTIMYGHVDAPPHWVGHLRRIRAIQEDTGGFTEFVPLPFVHQNAPIYLAGKARAGATIAENRRMHAMARIMLHGVVDNIQVSWVKLGIPGSQVMLQGGCNDFGGTLMEETISRMAGANHGIKVEPDQFNAAISEIGRIPAVRTTLYDAIRVVEPVDV